MTINESVSSQVCVRPRVISSNRARVRAALVRSFSNRFPSNLPSVSSRRTSSDLLIHAIVRSAHNLFIHSFIHSFISLFFFLSHWGNSMITARLSSSSSTRTPTHTHSPLIEISSNAARTHLTDAHQMHVIHPTGERDYTSHSILSLLVDLPSCFRVTRTCPCTTRR